MQHQDIAIRFAPNPNPHELDIPLSHHYRRRWWLPQLGPTATCLLNYVDNDRHDQWRIHRIDELTTHLGIGYRRNCHQLHRTMTRLVDHGFGHFDVEPGDPTSPACITFYTTVRPVPHRISSRWPETLYAQHQEALNHLRIHSNA